MKKQVKCPSWTNNKKKKAEYICHPHRSLRAPKGNLLRIRIPIRTSTAKRCNLSFHTSKLCGEYSWRCKATCPAPNKYHRYLIERWKLLSMTVSHICRNRPRLQPEVQSYLISRPATMRRQPHRQETMRYRRQLHQTRPSSHGHLYAQLRQNDSRRLILLTFSLKSTILRDAIVKASMRKI